MSHECAVVCLVNGAALDVLAVVQTALHLQEGKQEAWSVRQEGR